MTRPLVQARVTRHIIKGGVFEQVIDPLRELILAYPSNDMMEHSARQPRRARLSAKTSLRREAQWLARRRQRRDSGKPKFRIPVPWRCCLGHSPVGTRDELGGSGSEAGCGQTRHRDRTTDRLILGTAWCYPKSINWLIGPGDHDGDPGRERRWHGKWSKQLQDHGEGLCSQQGLIPEISSPS